MWDGSSITTNLNSWAFRFQAARYMSINYPGYDFVYTNSAVGGWATWPNLVTLQSTVLDQTPDLVVFDTANNEGTDDEAAHVEAYIRRIWAANPNTRIMAWNFPSVADVNVDAGIFTPTNQDELDKASAIFDAYGITRLDYLTAIQDAITGGDHLTDYMADEVHPNEGGHNLAYSLLQPLLPFGGATKPAVYPARLYDTDGEYENDPTIILGTSYTGRTGTGWVDTGTRTASSTAGDTITYTATCKSIGVYRADALSNANCEISVDGGAYRDATLYQNGIPLTEGLGAHTITIRLKAGGSIRIDEFWAI